MNSTWTGTTGTPAVTSVSNSYSRIYLNPSTDLVVGTNTITFSSWFVNAPSQKISFAYTVQVSNSPLQVAIVGAPAVSGIQPLTLSSASSKDPDNTVTAFSFTWGCISSTTYDCTEHLSTTTGSSVTLTPGSGGSQQASVNDVWTIFVNATKGAGRAGSNQVSITWASGSPPTLQIAGVPDSGVVLPSYDFYLYNKLDQDGYTYLWSVEATKFALKPLGDSVQGSTTSAITITGGSMSPGISYTVTCTVTSADGSDSVTDSVTFVTARPPWAGTMSYTLVSSGAYYLQDLYEFSLDNWNTLSSTAPLKYSWALVDNSTGALTPLSGEPSTTNYATFMIPAYGTVTVVGIVQDNLEQQTTVTATLTIAQGTVPIDAGTQILNDVLNGDISPEDALNSAAALNCEATDPELESIVDQYITLLEEIPIPSSLAISIVEFIDCIAETTVPVAKLLELYNLAQTGTDYTILYRDGTTRALYVKVAAELAARVEEFNEGIGNKRTIGASSATINTYQIEIETIVTNLLGLISSGQPPVSSTITDGSGNPIFTISVVKRPKTNIGTITLTPGVSVTFPTDVLSGISGTFADGVGVATVRADVCIFD
jgi:hypothetical protein